MRQYELDYYISTLDSDEIQHHGILGQKWGVRRYQNPDGSLTAEGRERYSNPKYQKKLGRTLAKDSYRYNSKLASGVYTGSRAQFVRGLNYLADRYNQKRKAYDQLSDSQKMVVRKAFNSSIKKRALADKAVSVAVSAAVGANIAMILGTGGAVAAGNPLGAIPGVLAGTGVAVSGSKEYIKDIDMITRENKLYKKHLKRIK